MKKLMFIVVLLVFAGGMLAQDFEFTGYVVEMPIYQNPGKDAAKLFGADENIYMNLNRVRLKPELYLFEDTRINLEYEAAGLYFNKSAAIPVTSVGKTNRQIFDLSGKLADGNNYILNHIIDRFYIRQDFDWGNVVVGRQRIAWGSGRVWNPTDLFNPINPANFAKIEKDGADAILSAIYLGNFTDLDIVFNPNEKIANSNFGARFRTNIGVYDYSIIVGRFDKRLVGGLDITGNLFGAGLRFEGVYSQHQDKSDDNFTSFIAGVDNQFTAELYTLVEYHYNGAGEDDKNKYNLNDLLSGKLLNLGRHYMNVQATYQVNALVNAMFGVNKNFSDNSGYLNGTISYNVLQNLNLMLGGQYSFGDTFTEYWYYGSSVYLQSEFYF